MDAGKLFNSLKAVLTKPLFQKNHAPGQKQAQYAIGGLEAAAYTKDRSFIWYDDDSANAYKDTYARQEVVRLTRYLVNNYPLFERVLSVAEVYAVGSGIVANAATIDDAFNETATAYMDGWADNAFCSNNQQYNFYEMQKLIIRELLIAGEVFIVLTKTPSGYPQLMLVPTENVRHSGDALDDSINGLYDDKFGKVTAYNIWTGSTSQKVDASNVIHLMRHKQIGQLRGLGAFTAVLNSARDHKDMLILEKKAIKVHSSLAAVVTKNDGRGQPQGLTGTLVPNPQLNPIGGTPLPTTNRGLEYAFAGNVAYMQKDEDIKLLAGNRSTEGFKSFLEVLLREVCLTLSIPYEFLVNSEKLTGPGIRFIIGDAAFFFNHLQNILIDGALNRIYGWVVASAINDGELTTSKGCLPFAVSWTTPIQVTIDQQRVSNIEISLVQNSMLTLEGYYSARGKDWKKEVTQRAKEEAFLNALAKETGVDINRLRTLQAGAAMLDAPKAEPDAS